MQTTKVTIEAPDMVWFEITGFGKSLFRRTDRVKIATYINQKFSSERWYGLHDTNNITITFESE